MQRCRYNDDDDDYEEDHDVYSSTFRNPSNTMLSARRSILPYQVASSSIQPFGLLNEVHVKIKLVRSRNSFCLMSAEEFKVKIENAIMFVKCHNVCEKSETVSFRVSGSR